ncbi:MAG: DUF1127 domain-containing protein [Rhodobacterales bacterium]|jgi:hypothetical protein|nr:DUF1127 domain-containing protein [Rhodobacterales bacterium]
MTHSDVSTTIFLPFRSGTGPMARLIQAIGVRQQRRKLAEMDDAQLRDIGVTRAEALEEAERPIWDVPATWLR